MPQVVYNYTIASLSDETLSSLAEKHKRLKDNVQAAFSSVDAEVASYPHIQQLYSDLLARLQAHSHRNAHARRVLADARTYYNQSEAQISQELTGLDRRFDFSNMNASPVGMPSFLAAAAFIPFFVPDPLWPGGNRPTTANLGRFSVLIETGERLVLSPASDSEISGNAAESFYIWLGMPDFLQSVTLSPYYYRPDFSLGGSFSPLGIHGGDGVSVFAEDVWAGSPGMPILDIAGSLQQLLPVVLCASLTTVTIAALIVLAKKGLSFPSAATSVGTASAFQSGSSEETKLSQITEESGDDDADTSGSAQETSNLLRFAAASGTVVDIFVPNTVDILRELLPFAAIFGASVPVTAPHCLDIGLRQLVLAGETTEIFASSSQAAKELHPFEVIEAAEPVFGITKSLKQLFPDVFTMSAATVTALGALTEKTPLPIQLSDAVERVNGGEVASLSTPKTAELRRFAGIPGMDTAIVVPNTVDILHELLPFAVIFGVSVPVTAPQCLDIGLRQLVLAGETTEIFGGSSQEAKELHPFEVIKAAEPVFRITKGLKKWFPDVFYTSMSMVTVTALSARTEKTLLPFRRSDAVEMANASQTGSTEDMTLVSVDAKRVNGEPNASPSTQETEPLKHFAGIPGVNVDISVPNTVDILHELLPFAVIFGASVQVTVPQCLESGIQQFVLVSGTTGMPAAAASLDVKEPRPFEIIKAAEPVITVPPTYLASIAAWVYTEDTNTAPWSFSTATVENVKDLLKLYASRKTDAVFTRISAFGFLAGDTQIIPKTKLFDTHRLAPIVLTDEQPDASVDEPARQAYTYRLQQWMLEHQDDVADVVSARLTASHDLQDSEEVKRYVRETLFSRVYADSDFIHIEAYLRTLFDNVVRLMVEYSVCGNMSRSSVVQDTVSALLQPQFSEVYSLEDVIRSPGRAFSPVTPVVPVSPLAKYTPYVTAMLLSADAKPSAQEALRSYSRAETDEGTFTGANSKLAEAGISAVIVNQESLGGIAEFLSADEAEEAPPGATPVLQLASFLLYKSDSKVGDSNIRLNGMNVQQGSDRKDTEEINGLRTNKQSVGGMTTEDVDNNIKTEAVQTEPADIEPVAADPQQAALISALCNAVAAFGIRGLVAKAKKEIEQLGLFFAEDSMQGLILNALSDTMDLTSSVISEMMPLAVFVQFALASDQFVSQLAYLSTPLAAEVSSSIAADIISAREKRRQV